MIMPIDQIKEDKLEFLQRRRQGIGGSDVAAILGVSPWKTPLDVWKDKTGRVPLETEETAPMHWGSILEDVVASEFAVQTGKTVQRRNKLYIHPEHSHMIANIDRYIVGEKAVLECKSSNAFMAKEWGEFGTDQVPMQYLCQVQMYMETTGYHEAFLAVLIGGNDFRIYELPYDEEFAGMIVNAVEKFWQDHIIKDIPPACTTLGDVNAMYACSNGATITASASISNACEALGVVKEQIKVLDAEKAKHEMTIKEFLGENEILISEDAKKLATWKSSVTNRMDTKKLKAEKPDIYTAFCNQNESRRFLLK